MKVQLAEASHLPTYVFAEATVNRAPPPIGPPTPLHHMSEKAVFGKHKLECEAYQAFQIFLWAPCIVEGQTLSKHQLSGWSLSS